VLDHTPARSAQNPSFRALTVFSVSYVLKNFALVAKAVDAAALARQPPPPRPVRTAVKFFQHGGSAESTVITEQKRPASTEKLHHVAIEAVRQAWHVVVQQQTDVDTAHAQVRSELHSMDWRDRADGFDFQDKLARDNNIRLEAVADFRALIEDGNCDLPGEGNACVCQFSAQAQRIPTVRGRYVGAPRSPTLLLDQRFRKKHNALSVSTVLSALPPC